MKPMTTTGSTDAAAEIVLFDCESFPNIGLTWGTWDQKVIKVLKRRMVCSIAWQFYPSRKRFVKALCDFPGYDPKVRSNRALMDFFRTEVLDKADIAVGHNIDAFDDPMINTDIGINRQGIPAPHRTVDTLKFIRHKFRFNSNRLDDVCQELGIGKKVPHPGIEMWEGCMAGDAKSWANMKRYNLGDVDPLLRGLYEFIRPWMIRHPATRVRGRFECPMCHGTHIVSRGWKVTRRGRHPKVQCQDCGHWPLVVQRKVSGKYEWQIK